MKRALRLTVNGDLYNVLVETNRSLLDVIREEIGLTGTKKACAVGECGACTVLLNGKPVNSCLVLAHEADNQKVLTIEGLSRGGKLHPIQQAFVDHMAMQCGFCTPGMVFSSLALLGKNPKADDHEIRKGLLGNVCRCTGYVKIIEAGKASQEIVRGKEAMTSKELDRI